MTERTYSDRGFAQHQPIPAGTAYGGTVRVYESSSALAPRIWLAVEALDDVPVSDDMGVWLGLHVVPVGVLRAAAAEMGQA